MAASAAAAVVSRTEGAMPTIIDIVTRWKAGERSFPSLTNEHVIFLFKRINNRRICDSILDAAIENKVQTEETFNEFIASSVKHGDYTLTKNAMQKARQYNFVPGLGAYASMGQIVGKIYGWQEATSRLHKRGMLGINGWNELIKRSLAIDGLNLYRLMKEKEVQPTLDTFHALINAHANKGNLTESQDFPPKGVFDEMRRLGIQPDTRTYEMLTVLHDYHDPYVAKKMQQGMKQRNLTPTLPTYMRWIKMATTDKDFAWGEELWNEVKGRIESLEPKEVGNLISAFASSPIATEIARVAVAHKKIAGAQGYNYIISGAAQVGDLETCTAQIRIMQKEGYEPNAETYTHLMRALLMHREFARVIAIYDQLSRSLRPTHATFMHALSACAAEGRESDMQRAFARMKTEKIEMRAKDFHAILGYMKSSSILAGLIRARVFPNKSDWDAPMKGAVLRMYARTKDSANAMAQYHAMTPYECAAQDVFDVVLLMLLDTDPNKAEIKSVYHQAKEAKHVLQNTTYDALVMFFAKKGEQNTVNELVAELGTHNYQMGEDAAKAVQKLEKSKRQFAQIAAEEMALK